MSSGENAATSTSHLKKHVEIKHKEISYPWPCDQCEFSATTTADLKKHIENKYEDMMSINVKECDILVVIHRHRAKRPRVKRQTVINATKGKTT